jgi:protein SCO1/2
MLCTLVLNDLVRALRALPLELGRDFEVVTVSIDPRETPQLAATKKASYVETYGRDGSAWHFLVGDEASIGALARAIGFRYVGSGKNALANDASDDQAESKDRKQVLKHCCSSPPTRC